MRLLLYGTIEESAGARYARIYYLHVTDPKRDGFVRIEGVALGSLSIPHGLGPNTTCTSKNSPPIIFLLQVKYLVSLLYLQIENNVFAK